MGMDICRFVFPVTMLISAASKLIAFQSKVATSPNRKPV